MGVFSILKYGSTNLNCKDSLQGLPCGLLEKYWLEVNKLYNPNYKIGDGMAYSQTHDGNHQYRSSVLSRWSDTVCKKQSIFDKVLKEYLDDNI